ncbi:MAG: right-handed parallel beta-helix repeat-containing protein [Acidobacteriota bacterium]|nr:right-handed parallel beta-helix repeat-containing protein [Acidobacteriota bacterium]
MRKLTSAILICSLIFCALTAPSSAQVTHQQVRQVTTLVGVTCQSNVTYNLTASDGTHLPGLYRGDGSGGCAAAGITEVPGLDSTGVADASATIQARVNALGALGGTVWLPAGVFNQTVGDKLPSNIHLHGEGEGVTILRPAGATLAAVTDNGLSAYAPIVVSGAATNVSVSGLTIDLKTNSTAANGIVISADGASGGGSNVPSNVTVRDVQVLGWNTHQYLVWETRAKHFKVLDSYLDGGVSAPQRSVSDAAITSGLKTLTSATANFTAADVNRYVDIVGAGAGGADLTTYITAVTNSTTATVNAAAGTTVSGKLLNILATTTDQVGIEFYGGSDLEARGNTVTNVAGNGIGRRGDANATPSIDATGIVIADNVLDGNGIGIQLNSPAGSNGSFGTYNAQVHDNLILNSPGDGILVNADTGTTFDNVQITNNQVTGGDACLDLVGVSNGGSSRTLSDGVATATSTTFTSTTGQFSVTDVGKTIVIQGAGVAGAALTTTIASVTANSQTSVVLSAAASTSISGASYTISGYPAGPAQTVLSFKVSGNTFEGCANPTYGLVRASYWSNTLFDGNKLRNAANGPGVLVTNSNALQFTRNRVNNVNAQGFFISTGDHIVLDGNVLKDYNTGNLGSTTGNGIKISTGYQVVARGNYFTIPLTTESHPVFADSTSNEVQMVGNKTLYNTTLSPTFRNLGTNPSTGTLTITSATSGTISNTLINRDANVRVWQTSGTPVAFTTAYTANDALTVTVATSGTYTFAYEIIQ